ncbi:MAG: hydantoinase/oxoprolinase family protein, partial [Planctomycetota bacterium]
MDQPDERTSVIAFDVGGANLKAADGLGWTRSVPFPLWQRPAQLPAVLARMAADYAQQQARGETPRRIVATMTGEIADCYPSRRVGVEQITAALAATAAASVPAAELGVYLVDGTIVPAAVAAGRPLDAAASNWHAVARLGAAHATSDRAFVVDIGSTTTDIIPIHDGRPAARGRDDVGRLATGELVYTGVERTPVAALVRSLPWAGGAGPRLRPIASERYADSRDVWLLLGDLAEDPASQETADGRPATRAAARVRLARMLLVDPDDFSWAAAEAAAKWCAEAQGRLVARALARVAQTCGWRPTSLVLSGHGGCLARRALARLGWEVPVVVLPEILGPDVSRAAPAHALALIAC